MDKYNYGGSNKGGSEWRVQGDLSNTGRKISVPRVGNRTLWEDEKGQKWLKFYGKIWKFPEQVEY